MGFNHQIKKDISLIVLACFLGSSLVIGTHGVAFAAEKKSYPLIFLSLAEDYKANAFIFYYLREEFAKKPIMQFKDLSSILDRGSQEMHYDNLKQAKEHFNKGKVFYDESNFISALAELEQSVLLYEQSFSFLETEQDFIDALVYYGVCTGMSGVMTDAVDSFKKAINFKPDAVYDFSKFPPHLKELYEKAKSELESAPRGSLEIVTIPANAEVYVNGHFKGISPIIVQNLPEGRNYIRIEKVGYSKWNSIAEIKGNTEESKTFQLMDAKRSMILNNILPALKTEITKEMAGDNIVSLRSLFFVDYVLFLDITDSTKKMNEKVVMLRLYNLDQRLLVREYKEKVEDWTKFSGQAAKKIVDAFMKDIKFEKSFKDMGETPVAKKTPLVKKWWFWTILVVALGGTGAALGVYFAKRNKGLTGLPKVDGTGALILRF
jgi:tetratricopeptide (TPR) repeat protein